MDLSFLKQIFRLRQVYWSMLYECADYSDGGLNDIALDRSERPRLALAAARD